MESLETVNQQLLDTFGKFDDHPRFRVVWSEDQYEKRIMTHSAEGLELPEPEVREVRKYSHYIREKYIMEMLMPVGSVTDLVTRLSYEPVWTFVDKNGNALPPIWDACWYIAETVMANMNKTKQVIKDPDTEPGAKFERIKALEQELFGNETSLGDSLKRDTAVGYGTRNRSTS